MDRLIANEFKLGPKLGSGSFGDIYQAESILNGNKFAVKLESNNASHPQLLFEARVYRILRGGVGIPNIKWYGEDGNFNVMVMDELGPSLEDLFNMCNRKFSVKTVLMLADQMISRIEHCHRKNFLHRDIKPDNFLIGLGDKRTVVYIIDLGLAKKYMDHSTKSHIPFQQKKNLTGTARYASINAHLGNEQGRRDDLESLGYTFMYFNRGSLPWQGLKAANRKQKYDRIVEKKMGIPLKELCRGYPPEFMYYLDYCRKLKFESNPDYNYLRRLMSDAYGRLGFPYDSVFDWSHCSSYEMKYGPSTNLKKDNGQPKKLIMHNSNESPTQNFSTKNSSQKS
eukprot:Sdes_comp16310_c0_seq1m5664